MGIRVRVLGEAHHRVNGVWAQENYEALKDRGIEVMDANYDLTVVSRLWFSNEEKDKFDYEETMRRHLALLKDIGPFVFTDCSDSTHISAETRERFIKHGSCLGYFRNSVYRDPYAQNEEIYDSDLVHKKSAAVFDGMIPFDTLRVMQREISPALNAKDLRKIKLVFPLMRIERGDARFNTQKPAPLAKRRYDVAFMGFTEYGAKASQNARWRSAQLHRKWCVSQMRKLRLPGHRFILESSAIATKQGRNRIHPDAYHTVMRDTKIAVCPWGWSAWTWRDIEAIGHGCIIIKPHCSEVQVHPDIYHPESEWVRWCKPDFSDLQEVVDDVLNYVHCVPVMADFKAEELLDQLIKETDKRVCLDMFAANIKECVI